MKSSSPLHRWQRPHRPNPEQTAHRVRTERPKIYSRELVDMRILSERAAGKEKLFIDTHLRQLLMNDEHDALKQAPPATPS